MFLSIHPTLSLIVNRVSLRLDKIQNVYKQLIGNRGLHDCIVYKSTLYDSKVH